MKVKSDSEKRRDEKVRLIRDITRSLTEMAEAHTQTLKNDINGLIEGLVFMDDGDKMYLEALELAITQADSALRGISSLTISHLLSHIHRKFRVTS